MQNKGLLIMVRTQRAVWGNNIDHNLSVTVLKRYENPPKHTTSLSVTLKLTCHPLILLSVAKYKPQERFSSTIHVAINKQNKYKYI